LKNDVEMWMDETLRHVLLFLLILVLLPLTSFFLYLVRKWRELHPAKLKTSVVQVSSTSRSSGIGTARTVCAKLERRSNPKKGQPHVSPHCSHGVRVLASKAGYGWQ